MFGFLLLKEKKVGQKNKITEIYKFWFLLVQKWPFRDAQQLFKGKRP